MSLSKALHLKENSLDHRESDNIERLMGTMESDLNFLDLRRFDYSAMQVHEYVDARVLHALPAAFSILNQCYLLSSGKKFPRLLDAVGVTVEELDELCSRYSTGTRPTAIKLSFAFADRIDI